MADDVQKLVAAIEVQTAAATKALDKYLKANESRMAKIERDARKAAAGMDQAFSKSFGKMGNSLKAFLVGYLSISAIKGFGTMVAGALDAAAAIKDVANAADVSTKYLQEMRYAVSQNGGSAETLDDALSKLTTRLGDFRTSGAGPAKTTLEQLGLATDVMNGKFRNTEDAADAIFKALANVRSNADRTAMAADLFGKAAGPKLAEFLRVGEAGIKSAREEAQRLGLVIGDDMINSADDASDKLNALWATLETAGVAAIANNAGAIRDWAQSFIDALPHILAVSAEFAKFIGLIGRSNIEVASRQLAELGQKVNELEMFQATDPNAAALPDTAYRIAMLRAQMKPLEALINSTNLAASAAVNAPTPSRPAGPGIGQGAIDKAAEDSKKLAEAAEKAAEAMAKLNAEIASNARELGRDSLNDAFEAGMPQLSANVEMTDEQIHAWDNQFDYYASGLQDAISYALTSGDAMGAAKMFAMSLSRMVADDMARDVYDALKDVLRGVSGGGGGGLLGSAISAVSGLIGGSSGGGGAFAGASGGGGSIGFASGGYTGNGGINQVAGAVHRGEYVFNAAATRRIGVPNLQAMARGQGGGSNVIHASFYGASKDDIPAMKAMIYDLQRQQQSDRARFPSAVKAVVNDGRQRSQIR